MKRRLLFAIVTLPLTLIGWFALLPSPIEPAAWDPPAPMPMTGAYAKNELKNVEWWAKQLVGPEAMFIDPDGTVVTGLKDGRIVRLKPGVDEPQVIADTHGRPLALARHGDGRIIICDAHRGLLALSGDNIIEVLASEFGGIPFRFTDDLAIAANGVIFFTDALARHSIEQFTEDLIEHQTTGRALRFDPATRRTSSVADGFSFATHCALARRVLPRGRRDGRLPAVAAVAHRPKQERRNRLALPCPASPTTCGSRRHAASSGWPSARPATG